MKLAVIAVAASVALVLAGSAAADQQYVDSTGEVPGAIDVSKVAVSNDPVAGTITFAVTTDYTGPVDANVVFTIALNTDGNTATGIQGFDYLIGLNNQGSRAVNELNLSWHSEQSTFENGVWSITLPVADIGNPPAFAFRVYSDLGPSPRKEDQAPDAGAWSYAMVKVPPATVASVSAAYAGVPAHGKTFHVSGLMVALSDGTQTAASGITCRAALGGARLAGAGIGGCTFHLPATSKGKKLSVKVRGAYKSTAVAKTVVFRVK